MEEEEWVGEVERRLGGWEVGWEVGGADGLVVGAEEVSGAWVWVNPLLGDEGGWVEVGWVEVGWVEVGWVEVGWVEVGWVKVGWVEVGLVEVGWVEVGWVVDPPLTYQ